jgi:mRNA-degrading endonuclease RelE of RelBE toxin-antitoxin system
VTIYQVGYEPEADDEYWKLPPSLRRELQLRLGYLKAGPFRSYPGLQVKEVAEAPGAWRFHLRDRRVFYRVDGAMIWVVMIWHDRPSAYSASTLREVRRRMKK